MMAAAEKKKVDLKFGVSKERLKEMAGNTLASGGMAIIGVNSSGLADIFNAASNDNRPRPRAPRPPAP
jgi:hypothetical protein